MHKWIQNGYMPFYMKHIFRLSRINLKFTIDDFCDLKNDRGRKYTRKAIRMVITQLLFERYGDYSLISFFTGVNCSTLRGWGRDYIFSSDDIKIMEIRNRLNKSK